MSQAKTVPTKLTIRAWPKMIFLWPTAVLSLFMALANYFAPDWQNVWGGAFLCVFGLNLLVLTFEFPRATSLTLAMGGAALVLLLLLLNHSFSVIDPLEDFFVNRNIHASTEFYVFFLILLVGLFVGMFAMTRFDYWELTANELVHHHGLLGDIERFSTAGLKLNKEISDVFEYVLAGAGRVIMILPGNPRPIILENVLGIGKVGALSDRILDARVVRIEGTEGTLSDSDRSGLKAAISQEAEGT
ncbi:MAG: hypothetical protein U1D30_02965 [Planctomycetota bacterium]